MRVYLILSIGLAILLTSPPSVPQQPPTANSAPAAAPVSVPDAPPDAAATKAKFYLVVDNQKKNDTAMDLFERIERV